ncbi:hypothetical protein BWZ22_14320 [Seonamhaeicola sp. S2-3]|uniref:aspartate/glutamate racemase family protein n=1 Tax=Seonamhaeicola sp. S2-3 TaxID=1936081 RepID=UPI000972C43E|nr:aspartate/glutamate racemase family protein [Seonamhaeicola sp. S2-3]APY12325.1 hypothetical protein BWZ22_14320 [Seonamhaeicola sp. S2-3]
MSDSKLVVLGLGSRSTAFYLQALNQEYNTKFGGYSTCPLVLYNTNFHAINTLLPKPSKALETVLQPVFKSIQSFQASHVLIPNITLHETIDGLLIPEQIIHPIHLTINAIKAKQLKKVVVFGSIYTMTSHYIKDAFNAHNIDVILPDASEMHLIDSVRQAVYNHTETKTLMDSYYKLCRTYALKHTIILACTELSILKAKNNAIIDMAQLQIENTIKLLSK